MGRQIPFHAMVSDCNSLLSFVSDVSSVTAVLQDALDDSPVRESSPCQGTHVLILWKDELKTTLHRKLVAREKDPYYRVPSGIGLELSPSILTEWDGRPGVQGRVYTGIAEPTETLLAWFGQISRWIRRHWVPPVTTEWKAYFYQQLANREGLKLSSLRSLR